MPDKMNMFTWAEASSDATSKERTLPIMPTSTSYYNPLPILKINQDEDWMNIRPVLPCIKKSPRPQGKIFHSVQDREMFVGIFLTISCRVCGKIDTQSCFVHSVALIMRT